MVVEQLHARSMWSLPRRAGHAAARIPRSSSFDVISMPARFRDATARILRRARRPRAVDVRLADKLSFVLGVCGCSLTQWVFSDAPQRMWLLYSLAIGPLVALRLWMYLPSRMSLFLLDFCYLTQVLLLVHIHLLPCSRRLHYALFSLCTGPLALAVVAWRNSLVFHSIDKARACTAHARARPGARRPFVRPRGAAPAHRRSLRDRR